MGVMPINKLLISMSLPMVVSMMVQALYNIIDSIFVSWLSENALTAVSLAFPFQNLMIAVSSGTCVGVNAILSRCLGAREFDKANKCANAGLFLIIVSYVVFFFVGMFGSKPFFMAQTDNAEIIEGGTVYLKICTMASFGIFGQILFERLLLSTGKTVFSMISQLVGAIINIIFDPIFIFGWFGVPAMGIAGAAWATVMGQIIAMFVGLWLNVKYNKEIKLSFKNFVPSKAYVKEIYSVGAPSIIMMSIGSAMTFCLNKILINFTATATAVLGVYFKLQSFIFMPVFGLNNGMIPIIAYNYGAKNKERVMKTFKLSVIYAVCIMMLGFAAFQLVPKALLGMFNASDEMLSIGVTSLRTISYSFLFAGFCIVMGSVFQALGNGVYTLIISVMRQLVVLVPTAYLFSLTGNIDNVWLAFPIAEIACVIAAVVLMRRLLKIRFPE